MSAERTVAAAAVTAGVRQRQDVVLLGRTRHELAVARQIRARALVVGAPPAEIAVAIASECGSSKIRAYRLALGTALADVVTTSAPSTRLIRLTWAWAAGACAAIRTGRP